ncbi:MAG: transcriptional repressor [Legionella sp.]|nr:transcriptional repressor [Legionella sp.]
MIYPVPFNDYCASIESRLTSLRKSILYILWHTEKPLKAYEILNALLQIKENSQPSTVYRVLDYFVNSGVVHKIESIQSYTLCREPRKHLPSEVLMVCSKCHHVRELYDTNMRALVQKLSCENFFHLGEDAIELKGLCATCVSL